MKIITYFCLLLIVLGCKQQTETSKQISQQERILPQLEPNRYNVAFLIMDGTFNTEFTAPFDIFQHTQYRKNIKAMNTFTVANTLDPINLSSINI